MTALLGGLAVVVGMALLVYRKRQNERFFDPHHEQAFQLLALSFPDAAEGDTREEPSHA